MSAALALVTAQGERVAVGDLADLQQAARELFAGYGEPFAAALARIDATTSLQAAADEIARSTGARLAVRGPGDLTCTGIVTVDGERIRCNSYPHGHLAPIPSATKEH
ncbi:hypothetical protein [Rathayibacter sp. AY1E1]|uniref:hypothetical protein n=1 Tax=Rathayibacter sp. AY1E1 TaxID=2080549 RepID=UPI000CE7795F|nr:hypothetical protein [Rathayibacter sp. AY1E1]PPH51210.1 hypothetical protein C5C67_11890 [Rathayibacter sp. AY1E1]